MGHHDGSGAVVTVERHDSSGRSWRWCRAVRAALVAGGLAVAWVGAAAAQNGGAIVPVRPGDGGRAPGEEVWPEYAIPDAEAGARARSALPFTRHQLLEAAALLLQQQQAISEGQGPDPAGRVRRIVVEPGAGEAVPAIEVRHRLATVVDFRDATGSTWPIEHVLVDKAFTGGEGSGTAGTGNLVYLVPQRRFLEGNMVVKLKELAEPVILVLRDLGVGASDFGVEVRITRPGPNVDAAALVRPGHFHAGDSVLAGLLAGEIPKGALRVDVEGGGSGDRGWRLGEDLLLVTRRIVLSPGPWAAERGSGGRVAYRLPSTPRVLVTVDGIEHSLTVRERSPGLWGASGIGAQ